MVLLSGPRQAGKTRLSKEIAKEFSSSVYLTYDRLEDRKIIQTEGFLPSTELIILDEIHKMDRWKNYLKGIYDTKLPHQKILVTGSARLEIFKEVGDSLAGRYFLHRLFPLSPVECEFAKVPSLQNLICAVRCAHFPNGKCAHRIKRDASGDQNPRTHFQNPPQIPIFQNSRT